MKKVLYFHGGPGFNSHPEKNLLSEKLIEAGFQPAFWHEPSQLRPNGPGFRAEEAFQNYIEHAAAFLLEESKDGPVVLVGHSFGAHPLVHLANRHPEKISQLVYVAPGLDIYAADLNIFRFTKKDFEEHGDEQRSKAFTQLIDAHTPAFDENTEKGFQLVLENPRFIQYYWKNAQRMQEFLSFFQEEEYQLDIESFFSVRRSFTRPELKKASIPTLVIFGAGEIVVSKDAEWKLLNEAYSNLKSYVFQDSAHYPHIEETDRFVKTLQEEIEASEEKSETD
jgi:proline iminopeptidase